MRGRTSELACGWGCGAGASWDGACDPATGATASKASRQHTTTDTLAPSDGWQDMAQSLQLPAADRYWTFGPRRAVTGWLRWGMCPWRPCVLAAFSVVL